MRITVSTEVSAPIAQVWQAYSNPEDIQQWNAASDDWHTTDSKVDFREGGNSPRAWRPRTAAWDSISPGPTPE